MKLLLDLEGIFFGSGKAPVVLGVALIILFGIAMWMWIMDKRISNLEDQNDKLNK